MKQWIRFSLISGFAFSCSAYALEPIQGWYIGMLAGVSIGPSEYSRNFSVTLPEQALPFEGTATINNNVAGGGIGAVVGYRFQPIRAEAEVYYNYTSTRNLIIDRCTYESPTVGTPTGICPPPNAPVGSGVGFNGSTGVTYALVNFYYDWFNISEDPDNPVIPYLGLGIGGARVKNGVNFVNDLTIRSIGGTTTSNVAAGQFIVGISYFMDDYAWFGVDYRYLSTGTITIGRQKNESTSDIFDNQTSGRYGLNIIMFNVNFSFDNASLNGAN
ncbi:MAG: outer membrane beta-barrel protein [Legionella sp.]|jgi:opacity protein-like surface antigen